MDLAKLLNPSEQIFRERLRDSRIPSKDVKTAEVNTIESQLDDGQLA